MKDHRDFDRYFRPPGGDVLRKGATADACSNLRLALERLGYSCRGSAQPALFDDRLEDALRQFQIDHKTRSADGQCGPGTRMKLIELLLAAGDFTFERMPDPEHRKSGQVFISYARKDFDNVQPFIGLMQGWGYHIWYDRSISAGSVWSDTLREEVDKAYLVIAFLTPHSISREWVQKELDHADRAGKPILPIALEYLPTAHPLSGMLPKYQAFCAHPVSCDDLDELLLDRLADALRAAHARRSSDPPLPPPIRS
jgi:hypothetical protein